ncbi:MAG: AAA family ATPase [Candidatus Spechtbacteria bacterium]|nr:AAA family ATPase [Candidatus Spechtbacteria bacterium]
MTLKKLSADDLIAKCNPKKFANKKYTSDPLIGFIGQEKAYRALIDGLTQPANGYNIIAIDPGIGLQSVIKEVIAQIINDYSVTISQKDYCYVHNFDDPLAPTLLTFRAGTGQQFRADILKLYETLQIKIQEALAAGDYHMQLQLMAEDAEARVQKIWAILNREMDGDRLIMHDVGDGLHLFNFARRKNSDEMQLMPAELWINDVTNSISDEELQKRRGARAKWQSSIFRAAKEAQEISLALKNDAAEMTKIIAVNTINKCVDPLIVSYPQATMFIEKLGQFALSKLPFFSGQASANDQGDHEHDGKEEGDDEEDEAKIAFYVNVYVENNPDSKMPLIVEASHMTYADIFGELDRDSRLGTYYTDHSKLSAGAIAVANGGVLFIDGNQFFTSQNGQQMWDALRHTLKTRMIELKELADEDGIPLPHKLRPQPIPFEGKVVLLISPAIYELLLHIFPSDVHSLFCISAWFSSTAPRTKMNEYKYAQFVTCCQQSEGLLAFTPSAIARIIEYGSRLAEDKEKLFLNMSPVKALVIEASTVAQDTNAREVTASHVERAISIQRERVSLIQDRGLENIVQGQIIIRVKGNEIGRGNALAVFEEAGEEFGLPVTITALRHPSEAFAISILDADAGQTGKVFKKSGGIITSIIKNYYGASSEILFDITISFEQTYDEIDGDSASTILICTALSAIGNIPLRQDVAITGSANQLSETQAIGVVNQKIEGFFDTCVALGALAGQTVLIPEHNVRDLMVRKDVVLACEKGAFNVYSYSTWREAMEFITGLSMAEVDQRVRAEISKAKRREQRSEAKKKKKKTARKITTDK